MNQIKQLVLDAVMGKAFLSVEDARLMEDKGFATFNDKFSWKWNKEALGKLSTEQLGELWMREG